MRLLLAEDEEMMADAVIAFLSYHGHQVDWAEDGLITLQKAQKNEYDCLILDVMMPGMDGVSVLQELRTGGNLAPAIFLTAKSELADKRQGFQAGGDDYLTKPFAMEELVMRVQAITRRGQSMDTSMLRFSDLVLSKETCSLKVGKESCLLSHREYQLISFLMQNPKIFFSADMLLDRVWGMNSEVEQGTVWAHISYLRRKLETLGAHAAIQSKRGIGYALEEKK